MFSLTIESRRISLIKGITWRIIGTMDTIFLSWLFTGNIAQALKIGTIELLTKIILYYLHERIWIYFKIGRKEVITQSGHTVIEDMHSRSLIKGISWRVFGTIDTFIIAFFVTGNFTKALEIGSAELFTKLILYYLHERAWIKLQDLKIFQYKHTGL